MIIDFWFYLINVKNKIDIQNLVSFENGGTEAEDNELDINEDFHF